MNIKNKYVCFKKTIKNHGLIFCYNIREYNLLGVGCVAVRIIPCRCSEFLRKLKSPCNISQDKYNQYRCKGENQNFIYWPILGSYNK